MRKGKDMKRFLLTALLCLASVCLSQTTAKTNPPHAAISTKGLSAASSPTGPSVSLACTSPGAPANSFNFYRSTTSGSGYVIIGSSTTCSYTDTAVTFGVTYYYVSTAVNTLSCPSGSTCESADSNQATATIGPNPVPNPPTGLTVTGTTANLRWNSPIPQSGVTVNAYTVWRGGNPLLPSPSKIATVTATMYTDTTCKVTKANPLCYYEVKATDTMNKKQVITGPSNIVSAK